MKTTRNCLHIRFFMTKKLPLLAYTKLKKLNHTSCRRNSKSYFLQVTYCDIPMAVHTPCILYVHSSEIKWTLYFIKCKNFTEHSDEEEKVIPIRVYKFEQKKPYLGGFRNKINGVVYHHASAQTVKVRRLRWQDQNEKSHRTTQTAEYKTRSTQSNRESGTQMSRPDLYLDGKNDKLVSVAGRSYSLGVILIRGMIAYVPDVFVLCTVHIRFVMDFVHISLCTYFSVQLRPKPYFTAAELAELKERMVLQLQCAWRCYVSRVRTQKKRDQLEERQRLIDEANQKKKQEEAELKQRNFERRKHPRTIEDFEILYNELESWRYNENKRIKGLRLPKEEEQKLLQQLLAKETKLLQTIDRLKIIAAKENKKLKVQKKLNLMSMPKKWELRTTDVAEVHTPFTTRSKELMDLYNGLISRNLSVDGRLDMLLHVKWTVKEFDCSLTRDLVDLIDRETDLLNRGRSGKSLEGLRKRIATLFLQFIETPSFNPEATRFQRVETNEPEKQPLDTRTRKFW